MHANFLITRSSFLILAHDQFREITVSLGGIMTKYYHVIIYVSAILQLDSGFLPETCNPKCVIHHLSDLIMTSQTLDFLGHFVSIQHVMTSSILPILLRVEKLHLVVNRKLSKFGQKLLSCTVLEKILQYPICDYYICDWM